MRELLAAGADTTLKVRTERGGAALVRPNLVLRGRGVVCCGGAGGRAWTKEGVASCSGAVRFAGQDGDIFAT